MKKRLVIAGGGHAHMMLLARIGEFIAHDCEVSVIGPSEHHYYSGMGPGLLGGTYRPEEIRFATRLVCEKLGGRFIEGKVRSIDPDRQVVFLDGGEEIPYNYLSCNLGSQVPQDMVSGPLDDIFLVKPIERLLEAQQRILDCGAIRALRIGVVGGGPSAVEIAGNIYQLGQTSRMHPIEITIFAGRQLMPDHPQGVRDRAIRSLKTRDIRILEGSRVTSIETGQLTASDGAAFDVFGSSARSRAL